MQFTLGVLATLCSCLMVALYLVWNKWAFLIRNIDGLYKEVREVHGKILKLPAPVQNVIHLGINKGAVGMDIEKIGLSVRPQDFAVNAAKLEERLLERLADQKHGDISTRAWCILKYAGIREIIDLESAKELDAALTRLLINDDIEGAKKFLKTVAESVCQASVAAATAPAAE